MILPESTVRHRKTFQQVTDLINSLLIDIDLKLFLYDGFSGFELFEEFLGLGLACWGLDGTVVCLDCLFGDGVLGWADYVL